MRHALSRFDSRCTFEQASCMCPQGTPSLEELKKQYYALMIRYHAHSGDYLEICRAYRAVYEDGDSEVGGGSGRAGAIRDLIEARKARRGGHSSQEGNPFTETSVSSCRSHGCDACPVP